MKINKYFAIAALAAAAAGTLSSCDKDGDTIYTNGAPDAELEGSATEIVLDVNKLDALVMTVYWNENGDISLSDPRVEAPDHANSNVLQMASDADFSNVVEETMAGGVYQRQFTCRELNNLVSRLGMEGGVEAPLYVRIKSSLGANLTPKYSNTLVYSVTPYLIDMTVGFVLDASQNDTGRTLASPESNGIYSGFIGAGSWENWWLREGNNTVWGNDGVTGTAFVMGNNTTGLDVWNFWYPGMSGCYYTVVNTTINEWSALYISELKLGGDITGDMVYDRKANHWTYTFNATAGTVSVTLTGAGKQYNAATGTDDAAAADTPAAFSGSADNLEFGQTASPVTLSIPANGETTITLDLNDPLKWTLKAEAGGSGPVVVVPPMIYLSGVYGEWNFDYYLKLYNEDNMTYGGALPVNSEWGYKIYTEAENWDNFYSMVAGGTGFEGKLEANGQNNVAAPEPGFYLFDVSLSGLTYKVTPITSVSYTGLNDDWSLSPMTATEIPGVYTAEIEKTANTPWGVKIILNENWDLFFGGNGTPGELVLYRDGFEGDNDLPNGKHKLTVDLTKGTYSYE